MCHPTRQAADCAQPLRFPQVRLGLILRAGVERADHLKFPAPYSEAGAGNQKIRMSTVPADMHKLPRGAPRS